MEKYQGKGINKAVVFGKIRIYRRAEHKTEPIPIKDADHETARFLQAKTIALRQLTELYTRTMQDAGAQSAEIFEAHQLLMEDAEYNRSVRSIIREQLVNAEYAVMRTGQVFADKFHAMEDPYLRERAADIQDISARLIQILSGSASDEISFGEKAILCADDFTPSEAASLDRDSILAFVTARGSLSSHTAILAKDKNIPAVIGVGDEFFSKLKDGIHAVVDSDTGEVFLMSHREMSANKEIAPHGERNPNEETALDKEMTPDNEIFRQLRAKQRILAEKKQLLQELKGRENITLDGKKINIYANIGSVSDVERAIYNDAGGIGLFRSEFLYLERTDCPSEEEQFHIYQKVLERMEGKRVIIRTLDIGADKQADYFRLKKEENPALGCRAIRLCLMRPEIFKTQLRALYRASVYGNLGILFPMITSVPELEKILAICGEVKEELKRENIPFSDQIRLGIMIETPAAAIISDRLAPLADFFSVGTNDLTQYTLACDRQNPDLEPFVDPHHEAILRLIGMSAQNAHRHGIPIGICGELGADTALTEAFLRMGIDELSVSPDSILKVRQRVREISLIGDECSSLR